MTNLKRFTVFFLFSYILLSLMSALESVCYGSLLANMHTNSGMTRSDFFYSMMEHEIRVHYWLKLLTYISLFFFMAFWNHLVKKHQFGKGFHVLIILLGFLPLVNYVLLYVLWRSLNKTLYIRAGKNYNKSDQLIILIWILNFIAAIIPLLAPYLAMNSRGSVSITTIAHFTVLMSWIHVLFQLMISLFLLFYFIGLMRVVKNLPDTEEIMAENALAES